MLDRIKAAMENALKAHAEITRRRKMTEEIQPIPVRVDKKQPSDRNR